MHSEAVKLTLSLNACVKSCQRRVIRIGLLDHQLIPALVLLY